MTGLIVLLGTGFLLLWAAGVMLSMWLLTHPPRRTYSAAVSRGRPGDPSELPDKPRMFELWRFESRGLSLPVWDVPGDRVDGPVVILTHGWADSKIGGMVRLSTVAAVASRVLIWDLPGHGEAPGLCRMGTAEVEDLLALMDRVGDSPIVLMGWSLGAGVSLAAAVRAGQRNVVGVIAEAPYRLPPTPAANVLRARGLPVTIIVPPVFAALRLVMGAGLGAKRFDRARAAMDVRCPVLVIHGGWDVVCPVEDGRAIAAACGGDILEVAEGGHNDLWTTPVFLTASEERVQRFVRGVSVGGTSGSPKE